MPGSSNDITTYILYAAIVIVFIVVMKMPKKK